MLLSNRHSTFKLFSFTIFLTLCVIFYIWHFGHWKWVALTAAIASESGATFTTVESLSAAAIPEKIWYKLGPKGLSDHSREWIDTCLKKNPSYQSELMTDLSGDIFVKDNFVSRPDIVETYLALPIPILKADFLRYLLLFAEGGIWSDLDVSCADIPTHDWIPAQYKIDAGLVVGLEFDMGWGDNFVRQFASWTVMAKPGSPHILMVIDDILEGLREKTKEHNVMVNDLTLDMIGDVVDLTGPRRLTRSVFKSLELILDERIDDRNISGLLSPKLISDVLILPGYSFAASSNQYEGTHGPALVTHHYAGTWKNEHGGELA